MGSVVPFQQKESACLERPKVVGDKNILPLTSLGGDGIGRFNDDPDMLQAAADYLRARRIKDTAA